MMLFLILGNIEIDVVFIPNFSKLLLFLFKNLFLLFNLYKKLLNILKFELFFSKLVFGDRHLGLEIINLEHCCWSSLR